MDSLVLKNILLPDASLADIHIEGETIRAVVPAGGTGDAASPAGCPVTAIDCTGKMAMPGFVNMHTHAAMSLMRGVGEDVLFHRWLDRIWNVESKIDAEYVYWGTKAACVEMLRTGTTLFNDHYWYASAAHRAAVEMGIRPVESYVFLDRFDDKENDSRYLFTDGTDFTGEDKHDYYIINNSDFGSGMCALKFTNRNADGSRPTSGAAWPNTDYPIFRAADAYLMLAEAVLNGASGDGQAALDAVRERAGLGSITLTEDAIISERARELYWENMRRQDLIRFGLLTSSTYLWDWKGGSYEGNGVDERYNLYPIPSTEINSNSKLDQNPGY